MTFDEEAVRAQAKADGRTHMATGIAVLNDDGQVLVVQRASDDWLGGNYELPGGGVDPGESITDGAKRELMEECGLEVTEIVDTFRGFDYESGSGKKVRQINFVVKTAGLNIKLDPKEHTAFKWVGPNDYQDLVMTDEIKLCLDDLFSS